VISIEVILIQPFDISAPQLGFGGKLHVVPRLDRGVGAMKQEFGIGLALADTAALSPELEPVMPRRLAFPLPIWLTAHQDLLSSRRIRLVVDVLADKLQR
jgi:hypothetical protein